MRARKVVSFLCLVALAGCNATAASPSVAPAVTAAATATAGPSSTPTATPSPPTPVPSAGPVLFTSERYGYTVSVPAIWAVEGAKETWDGASPGSPGHDGTLTDQFTAPPRYASLWAYAAPTTLKLAAYATQTTDAAAVEHPCSVGSQKPEKNEAIVVDGAPARLLTIHCGILVLIAVTIHGGSGFVFAFQDANGGPSFDAEDRATFLEFLNGIHLGS